MYKNTPEEAKPFHKPQFHHLTATAMSRKGYLKLIFLLCITTTASTSSAESQALSKEPKEPPCKCVCPQSPLHDDIRNGTHNETIATAKPPKDGLLEKPYLKLIVGILIATILLFGALGLTISMLVYYGDHQQDTEPLSLTRDQLEESPAAPLQNQPLHNNQAHSNLT